GRMPVREADHPTVLAQFQWPAALVDARRVHRTLGREAAQPLPQRRQRHRKTELASEQLICTGSLYCPVVQAVEARAGRVRSQLPALPRHRRAQADVEALVLLGPVNATAAAVLRAGEGDATAETPVPDRLQG